MSRPRTTIQRFGAYSWPSGEVGVWTGRTWRGVALYSAHTTGSSRGTASSRRCSASFGASTNAAPMPEPSSSTGAQPSAEAVREIARATCPRGQSAPCRWCTSRAQDALTAAYRIDAPAIHAAGRRAAMDELREARFDASVARGEMDMAVAASHAAGRDEALREVVAWLREQDPQGAYYYTQAVMADAIESAFRGQK
jgi:hypothetical protein